MLMLIFILGYLVIVNVDTLFDDDNDDRYLSLLLLSLVINLSYLLVLMIVFITGFLFN